MSVLIKGMEMPKNCGECHFCHTENFHQWCCLTEETISAIDAKHFMCPLTQLDPCKDAVSRQAEIYAIVNTVSKIGLHDNSEVARYGATFRQHEIIDIIEGMPSAQLDGIPLEWIDKHLEWLDNCDNDFAQLAKVSIKTMVELWKKDRI